MNNKHFVGKRISAFERYDDIGPITGVVLLLDDENEIPAGDETGYVLEISCPYGTETMAANILASLKGKTYQGFRAENAILSPAAELGDGVTVNGDYFMLAHRTVNFGPGHMSEIEAPGESELENEYPWVSPEKKEFNRKFATTRSLISKTAEQIRLEIAGVEDEISYIQLDLDKITSRVQDAEGNISTLEQTATELRSEISGKIDGDYAQTLIDQTLEGIELSVSSANGSTVFKLTADGAELSAKTVNLSVDAVNINGTLSASQINLTGAITWGDLSDSCKNHIGDGLTEDDIYTYIDESLVSAPTIAGAVFMDYDQEVSLYLDKSRDGSTYGMYLEDDNGEIFAIWSETWAPEAASIALRGTEFLSVYSGIIYACGDWDFSNANVTGL